jgi:hypothetical protein
MYVTRNTPRGDCSKLYVCCVLVLLYIIVYSINSDLGTTAGTPTVTVPYLSSLPVLCSINTVSAQHSTRVLYGYQVQYFTVLYLYCALYCNCTATVQRVPFQLGSREHNAAKKHLNHAPFGLRPLQPVVWGGVYCQMGIAGSLSGPTARSNPPVPVFSLRSPWCRVVILIVFTRKCKYRVF